MPKNIRQLCLFILAIIIITSCKDRQLINWNKQISQFKESVKDEPFEFLADKNYSPMSVQMIDYPIGIHLNGLCGIVFKQILEQDKFEYITIKLKEKSVFKSDFLRPENYYTPDLRVELNNNKFPAPNFDDSWFSIKENVSLENSLILGFRHEKGNFFTNPFLQKISNEAEYSSIKDKVGKGYSNGAVIDYQNRTIYYWIIIW